MIQHVAATVCNRMAAEGIIESGDKEIIQFGLSQMFYKILHIITTMLIGFLLQCPLQAAAFISTYTQIRSYAGGQHAKTRIGCYLLSSLTSVFFLLAARYIPRHWKPMLSILFLPFSLAAIWKLAPVDNENRRLEQEECQVNRIRARATGIGLALGALMLTIAGLAEWAFIAAGSLLLSAGDVIIGESKNGK